MQTLVHIILLPTGTHFVIMLLLDVVSICITVSVRYFRYQYKNPFFIGGCKIRVNNTYINTNFISLVLSRIMLNQPSTCIYLPNVLMNQFGYLFLGPIEPLS